MFYRKNTLPHCQNEQVMASLVNISCGLCNFIQPSLYKDQGPSVRKASNQRFFAGQTAEGTQTYVSIINNPINKD